MILPMAMLIQVTEGDAPAARALPTFRATERCPRGPTDGDVVVCGDPDPDRHRLKPLPSRYERRNGLPAAETGLAGGKLGVVTQQGNVGGFPSNRIMLSWKLKF